MITGNWICIMLAHWNNSPHVDMVLHSDTLSWFWANQYLPLLLNAVHQVASYKYKFYSLWFGLIWPGLESTIYCTWGEYCKPLQKSDLPSLWLQVDSTITTMETASTKERQICFIIISKGRKLFNWQNLKMGYRYICFGYVQI